MVNDKTSWFPCKSPIYCTQTPSPNTIVSRECLASEIYSLEELHCCSKGCRWKQVTQTLICSKIQRCPSSNKVTLMVVCNDDQGLSLWSVVRRGPPLLPGGDGPHCVCGQHYTKIKAAAMRNLCPVLTLQVMNLHHFSLHVVLYINEYGPQVWKIFSYSETKCFLNEFD